MLSLHLPSQSKASIRYCSSVLSEGDVVSQPGYGSEASSRTRYLTFVATVVAFAVGQTFCAS